MTEEPGVADVLVVDDELLIRWSLHETLTAAGHTVTEAADGDTAIRALCERPRAPDVVVLDYRLPDSDDFRLLQTIRRLAPHSQVIMMTAYGTPDVLSGALTLGVYRVVSKPFEMAEVAALVAEAYVSGQG
jgi:DNA-binding NtrC family response regulator